MWGPPIDPRGLMLGLARAAFDAAPFANNFDALETKFPGANTNFARGADLRYTRRCLRCFVERSIAMSS